jgi:hypothetical protein
LRRRFGNALHWYAVLINAKELHIKGYLESARLDFQSNSEKHASGTEDMNQCSDTLSNESSSDEENSQPSPGIPGKMHIASYAFVFNHHYPKLLEDKPQTRPSEYLRSRCPLCFRGYSSHDPSVV